MMSCIRKGGVPLPSFPFSAAEWAERHLCGMRGVGRGDWELSDAVEQQLTSAPRGVPRTGLISSFVQLFRASEVTPDLSPGSRQHRDAGTLLHRVPGLVEGRSLVCVLGIYRWSPQAKGKRGGA